VSLLDDIRDEALDSTVSLSSVLRKCLVLAAKLKYDPLRDWVSLELNGYKKRGDLPDYRKAHGDIKINYISGLYRNSGQQLPYIEELKNMRDKMEEIHIMQSVDELEAMKDQDSLHMPLGPDLVALINHYVDDPYVQVYGAYVPVPGSLLSGVLSTVRTRILQFVLEIEDAFPEGDINKVSMPKAAREAAEKAFQQVIYNHGTIAMDGAVANVINVDQRVVVGDLNSLHAFLEAEGFDPQDFPALDEALVEPDAIEEAAEGNGPVAKWSAEAAKKVAKSAGNVVTQTITQVAIKAALAYAGFG
jgi:hypothetical protein